MRGRAGATRVRGEWVGEYPQGRRGTHSLPVRRSWARLLWRRGPLQTRRRRWARWRASSRARCTAGSGVRDLHAPPAPHDPDGLLTRRVAVVPDAAARHGRLSTGPRPRAPNSFTASGLVSPLVRHIRLRYNISSVLGDKNWEAARRQERAAAALAAGGLLEGAARGVAALPPSDPALARLDTALGAACAAAAAAAAAAEGRDARAVRAALQLAARQAGAAGAAHACALVVTQRLPCLARGCLRRLKGV
jgi:hypothetical protein